MIKNRMFAFGFRLFACVLCVFHVLYNLGIFDGSFEFAHALYYTWQSNALVMIMFGVLAYRTFLDLKKGDKHGNCGYFPRISASILMCIVLTLIVFWSVLSWGLHDPVYLVSYHNLSVHLITAFLMIADYVMFSKSGKLQKSDPLYFAVIPLVYLVQASILGFAGVNYKLSGTHIDLVGVQHFPYPFMDYYTYGGLVALFITAITAFIIGLSFLLLFVDKKRYEKSLAKSM